MEKIDLQEIYKVFRRQGLKDEFEEQSPLLVWTEICSPQMGRLTQPLRVRQGVLYIEAANHVVAQQLSLLKDSYLKKINEALGSEKIKDLRFRVDSRGVGSSQIIPENVPDQDDLLGQDELQELLDHVEDPRMKAVFERFIRTNLKWDRVRKAQGFSPCSVCGLYHDSEGFICYYCELERE